MGSICCRDACPYLMHGLPRLRAHHPGCGLLCAFCEPRQTSAEWQPKLAAEAAGNLAGMPDKHTSPDSHTAFGAPVQKCLTDVRDGCAGCVEVLLVLCRASFLAYACVQWPVVVLNLQRAFSSCLLSAMVRAQGPLLPHAVQACVLHRPVARDCRSLLTGHRADMSHP